MPESSSAEPRRLRVSRRLLTGAAVAFGAAIVLAIGSVVVASSLWSRSGQVETLSTEKAALVSRVSELDDRIRTIQGTVTDLRQLDERLRALTSVSDPDRNLAIGPVGETAREAAGPAQEAAEALRVDLLGGAHRATSVLEARTNTVSEEAEHTLHDVKRLSVFLEGQQAKLASTPSRRPAHGYVTSTFGMRVDPFTGLPQHHAGIDYSANMGAKVVAPADGTVVHASNKGAYGKTVEIDHGNGLLTRFAHLSRVDVRVGEKIKRGQSLGGVGNTGRSTGPHLHYEVRQNGIAVNPQRFLLD